MKKEFKPLAKCRICKAELEIAEKLEKIPLDGMNLLKRPGMPEYFDFDLFRCKKCGHYQLQDAANFSYVTDWRNTADFPEILNAWKKSIEFLSSLVPCHSKALEILCGNKIVGFGEKYFREILRLDMAEFFSSLSRSGRQTIFSGYSSKNSNNKDFDACYIYDIPAHIDDLSQIMGEMYSILKEGGVGWIEVPNGLTIINEQQYFSIFPEHINYFTPHSLSVLVQLAGFQTISIEMSLGGAHLDIFFRKPSKKILLSAVREQQFDFLLNEVSKYSKVVIWGAGAKTRLIFGILGKDLKVAHIVDSGTYKQGLFIPGASISIEAPTQEIFTETDLVIIFAVSFEREITALLREKFLYDGKIMSLSDNTLSNK